MTERLDLPGHPGLDVALRRSARTRRMTLRVGRTDGRVTLTLPQGASVAEARIFLADHVDWVLDQVAAAPEPRRVVVGGTLPLRGREVPVRAGPGRSARLVEDGIAVPDDARAGPRVKVLIQSLARTHLAASVQHYAERLGRMPAEVVLRDTRSRWGSCSSKGRLMFSWRLVMAPEDVLDYVAAHEVAHLVHMDHSPRFWAQVEALMPDYAPRRDWLRTHGAALQAVSFAAADG